MNQTGGGSWEEKILEIISLHATDGDACTPPAENTDFVPQNSLEEFLSVEFLEYEEISPTKKMRPSPPSSTLSTSKSAQSNYKKQQSALSSNSSKYKEAFDEAKKKCTKRF